MRVKMDKEFQKLIPPISDEQINKLTADILKNGCREVIPVWNGIVVGEFARYAICRAHKIPVHAKEVQELQGKNLESAMFWIIAHQLARVDLTDYQRGELVLVAHAIIAQQQGRISEDNERGIKLMSAKRNIQKSTGLSDETLQKIQAIQKDGTLEQIQRARSGGKGNSIDEIYQEIVNSAKTSAPCKPESITGPASKHMTQMGAGTSSGLDDNSDFGKVSRERKRISTASILIDFSYQRKVNLGVVDRIIAEFNPCLVNPIKVSIRDGKYYVFDGQHTMTALKKMNGDKDLLVSCEVFRGLTCEMEAHLFHEQEGIKTRIRSAEDLRARVVAKDVRVMDFISVTESFGFHVDIEKPEKKENNIVAIRRAFNIYSCDADLYKEMLDLLRRTWNGNTDSLIDLFLAGMFEFLKANRGQYDAKNFVAKLSMVNPRDIFIAGKRVGGGGNGRFANQIIYAYNKRLTGKRRLHEIQLYGK